MAFLDNYGRQGTPKKSIQKPEMFSKRVEFRLTPDQYEALVLKAKQEHVPIGYAVRTLVTDWVQ